MRPSFAARLVNGPLFDPMVFLRLINEDRAAMFDCGRFSGLSNKELLMLDAVFITHMHMDHFVGFDSLLRVILHREKPLNVYGPAGIIEKIDAKLRAYTWNLTADYPLAINVFEVGRGSIRTVSFNAAEGFMVTAAAEAGRSGSEIYTDPRFVVDAAVIDHNIPCLAFALRERFHVNIRPDIILQRGYVPGPWLGVLKETVISGAYGDIEIETAGGKKTVDSAALADEIVVITKGQKIAYLADARFSPVNTESFSSIAMDADTLFIEAFYLEEMKDEAYIKAHLTARQAGEISGLIRAKKVVPMHISPRYHDRIIEILEEAGCAGNDIAGIYADEREET